MFKNNELNSLNRGVSALPSTSVFSNALLKALQNARRALSVQLPDKVGFTNDEIKILILDNLFPASICDEVFGYCWDMDDIENWEKLMVDPDHAAAVEFILGRSRKI